MSVALVLGAAAPGADASRPVGSGAAAVEPQPAPEPATPGPDPTVPVAPIPPALVPTTPVPPPPTTTVPSRATPTTTTTPPPPPVAPTTWWWDGSADVPRATLGGVANSATFGRPPVAWRDAPDPAVIRVGNRYIAYTTNAHLLRVQVMTSFDLVNWTVVGDALPALGVWAADDFAKIWAPAVITSGGGYLLYYVAPDRGSGRQCIGTAWSAAPTGPFTKPAPEPIKCEGSQGGSIDPSVFERNGARYLLWKTDANAIGQPTRLWSQRLAADGRSLTGNPTQLLVSGATWERGIIEGPAMVHEGGRFLLFYSGSEWWEADYGIGYAVCSGPLGPCTKQTVSGPWEGDSSWSSGSGGAEFVRDPAGNLWMAYHGWTGAIGYESGGSRSLFIERVTVTGGVPVARNDLQRGGPADPFGATDGVRSWSPGKVDLSGWAIDIDDVPGDGAPVLVDVYVDNRFATTVVTGHPRPDVAAAYPDRNVAGFVASVSVAPGRHVICANAINVGPGSTFSGLGCQQFEVVAPPFSPVAATNDDGRLEVFAADAFGGLVHAWQVTPGGAWSAWQPAGGIVTSASPVVARNGDGRLEIFAVDRGGILAHRWQIPSVGWSAWTSMGVVATGSPAVGTNVDGRLELFVARSDGRLVHTWQAPPTGWAPVVDAGASASASPEMNASADGRLEVFVTSGDGGLLHQWQTRRNGPFGAWRYTGTFARGVPDAERSADGRLELFATTPQNVVTHSWQLTPNGGWSGWEPLGLLSLDAPTSGQNADGRLEVFATDGRGVLQHAWQTPTSASGWSRWESMGLAVARRPAAAVNRDTRLALFAVTTTGQLLQATQVLGVGWSPWRPVTPGLP